VGADCSVFFTSDSVAVKATMRAGLDSSTRKPSCR
jgi:hypothetical protein